MDAMLASVRPMNESTISSEEMSIARPWHSLRDPVGQVILKGERQLVVHVYLDGHEQVASHP